MRVTGISASGGAEQVDDAASVPVRSDGHPVASADKPRVGGLLLALCVSLIVLLPLAFGFGIIAELRGPATVPSGSASYAVILNSIARLVLIIWAIYAGWGLLTVRPAAVRSAERFILVLFGYALLFAVVTRRLGPTAGATFRLEAFYTIDVATFFVLWYTYLAGSKRVKRTYASPVARSTDSGSK